MTRDPHCLGCGEVVSDEDAVGAVLSTALGMTTVYVHPGHEEAAARNHQEQPARWRRQGWPETKEEKARRKFAEGAG